MDVSEAILMKRAIRRFKPDPLPEEVTTAILNAGRRAQSSKNTQPWRFIAVRDRKTLASLSQLGKFGGHLAEAALGVVILTPDPSQRFSIMFDAGQTAAYMQLAGWEMGVGSCLVTVYETEAARELLDIPDDLYVHIAISFGYPEDPDDLLARPKSGGRLPLDEITHYDRWSPRS